MFSPEQRSTQRKILEDLENYKDSKLKPASNVRKTMVRCCGTCRHHVQIDGFFCCRRQDGWEGDVGEGEQWEHVCDRWTAPQS